MRSTGGGVFVHSPETRIGTGEIACWYGKTVSGATIYAYVDGNPLSFTDPHGTTAAAPALGGFGGGGAGAGTGLVSGAAEACVANPLACVALVGLGSFEVGTLLVEPLVHDPLSNVVDSLFLPPRPGDVTPLPLNEPMQMAKGGTQNKANEWSRAAALQPDPCSWLRDQYNKATDSATRMKIKTAQKVLGCRKNSSTNEDCP